MCAQRTVSLCCCSADAVWCSRITRRPLTENKMVMFGTTQNTWANCFGLLGVFRVKYGGW